MWALSGGGGRASIFLCRSYDAAMETTMCAVRCIEVYLTLVCIPLCLAILVENFSFGGPQLPIQVCVLLGLSFHAQGSVCRRTCASLD